MPVDEGLHGRGEPSAVTTDGARQGSESDLTDHLSDLARTLEHKTDVAETLSAVVHAAVDTVPGAQEASISAVLNRREVITRAASGELITAVDQVQHDTGQGPCLDTLHQQRTVRLADLSLERRWPAFIRRVRPLGVGSMLAVQLYVHGDELGALNLVSSDIDAFSDDSERVALLFAAHAAVAMSGAQQQEKLRSALDSRDLIGQAKGILMERFKITDDQAFVLLVRASQNTNRKLRDVVDELVRSGDLPATEESRR